MLDLQVKELGLLPKYRVDDPFKLWVKKYAALAFVPVADVVDCFESLATTFLADELRERSHMTSARFAKFIPSPCQQLSALSDPPDDVRACLITLHSNFSLGKYINAVVSRIVIGTLDLKQFLPKFKYFC